MLIPSMAQRSRPSPEWKGCHHRNLQAGPLASSGNITMSDCGSRMSSKILMSSQVNPPSQEKSSITDSRCCLGGGHWEVMELLPILIKNCRYLSSVVFKSVVTNRRGPSLSNTRDFPEDRTPHLKLKEAPLICRALLVFKLESSTNCSIIVVRWGTTGRSHVSPV